jgi:hypothetical protein
MIASVLLGCLAYHGFYPARTGVGSAMVAAELPISTSGQASDEQVRAVTLRWVERVIVGLSLCPFAEAPLRAGAIDVAVSPAADPHALLAEIDAQCAMLLSKSKDDVATTLIAAPHLALPFVEFNDGVGTLEDETAFGQAYPAYEDKIMVVCFHPDHAWAGLAEDDPVNWEKRAPYPIVNLLRTEMVDAAILTGKTADIGERNEARLRREGIDAVRELYRTIFGAGRSAATGDATPG